MDHTVIRFEIPADDVKKLKNLHKAFRMEERKNSMLMDYWLIQTVPTDEKGMLL